MAGKYNASCLCESDPVAVNPKEKPAKILVCSCLDCAKSSGGPFQVLAMYDTEDLEIVDPKKRIKQFDISKTKSGAVKKKFFCGDCGCPIYTMPMHHEGKKVFLRASLMDHNTFMELKPEGVLFEERTPSWCKVDSSPIGGH